MDSEVDEAVLETCELPEEFVEEFEVPEDWL